MKPSPLPVALVLLAASAAFGAAPTYKVVGKIKIGGGARWDYSYLDTANHRLYVSHGTQTEVIDTTTDKLVGTIPGTNGVHGIAIAADLGRGFTSDGGDNDVTVFDLKTLKVLEQSEDRPESRRHHLRAGLAPRLYLQRPQLRLDGH